MNELMITLLENDWLLYVACGAAGIGGLIQIILSVIYNRSLNASERMRNTKIAWLRQMKTRYESGYEWNNRIRNVELFVDKNIGRRKWMGIYLKTWEELSKMMIPLILVLSALGAVGTGIYMEEKTMQLVYLVTGAMLTVILRGMTALTNLEEKQRLLRTNLCDYFENTLQGEAKNRRRENLREKEGYLGKQALQEEIACAADVDKSEKKSEVKVQQKQEDAEGEKQKEKTSESRKDRKESAKHAKVAAKSNKNALRQEKKKERQSAKLAEKEAEHLKKQEKRAAKETAKLQRKQAKEQKRVDKLAKRMEKMQLRIDTAATAESGAVQGHGGGKKEENARLKREQLKRKVDITPAQEDQIISEVLREFLA